MNKKFLSVVLFGALMVGSSVTFTGCIDNDEPAGITDLRGAKAALIRANEAYRLAEVEWKKVQVELDQVKVERAKVNLELKKLELQKEQAKTDYEVALYQAKKDSVIEDFKGKLLDLQTTTAEKEVALEKALAELAAAKVYAKDSVFANKLTGIVGEMTGMKEKLGEAMDDVADYTKKLLAFSSNATNVGKEFIAADIKSGESKLANDSVNLAEFKKLAADYSNDAVNAQILDIEKQIIAIDKKVAELKQSVITTDATAAPMEQAISKQKVTFEAENQSVTLNVPSAIESEFIKWAVNGNNSTSFNILRNEGRFTSNIDAKRVNGNYVYSFKSTPIIDQLALGTVPSDVKAPIDTTEILSAYLKGLATDVEKHGVDLYYNAYSTLKSVGIYNLSSLDGNATTPAEITANDKAKVAAALEKVNADLTTAETTYKADTTAFVAAYTAYKTAATAYGISQQLTSTIEKGVNEKWDAYQKAKGEYDAAIGTADIATKKTAYDKAKADYDAAAKVGTTTVAQLNALKKAMDDAKKAYDTALATVPSTALATAVTNLKTELTAYYPKRKALTGEVFEVSVASMNSGKPFVIADSLSTISDAKFYDVMAQGKKFVYGQPWDASIDWDKEGAVQAWVNASAKLYDTGKNIAAAKTTILPLDEVYAMVGNANVNTSMPTAMVYVTLQYAKNAFSTIDNWAAYANDLNKLAAEKAAIEAPIMAEVAKQKAALAGIYEPLRDTIYEICKLDATQYIDTEVLRIAGALGINEKPNKNGEKQALESLKRALNVTINGTLNITYTVYTYNETGVSLTSTPKTMTSTTGVATAVDDIEKNIVALRKYIAAKKDVLASYDNNSFEIDEKTKAEYEALLTNAEEELEGYQAAFNALSKAKDELIAAMTAE